MTVRTDITDNEFNSYYTQYIDQVPEGLSLLDALTVGLEFTKQFYSTLSKDQLSIRYAEGKWTPKEVLLHIIDTERIFSYRALRFARLDASPLAGFDQDDYVLNSDAGNIDIDELLETYENVRRATISLFKTMNSQSLINIGIASDSPLSPRAAAFIIAGHERHHIRIIQERYL